MNEIEAKKPTKYLGLSRNVISMGAVSFLNDLASDMIFPFIPAFLTSVLGAGAIFVGLVEGLADSTASVLKIISGRLSDRLRVRKPFILAGYSLSAAVKPLLALASAPWHVLLVRFADRVGKGMRDAPRDALLSFSTERKDFGRAFGFHRGADTLGAALGPILAFFLLPLIHQELRTLFLLSFAASFLAVIILAFSVSEVKNHNDLPERPKFAWKYLGLPFTIFLSATTIFSLGRASEAFLLLRAQNVGVIIATLPLIYFFYNITFALFSTPAGILSDKIGHRNTFMIGMLIFSGTYYLFGQLTSVFAMWLLFAVYGFYSALTEGVGGAIIADLVQEEWRATAYGMYSAFTGLATLPASLIFGVLWENWGPRFAFHYGALMSLTAFIIFLFLRIKNRRKNY